MRPFRARLERLEAREGRDNGICVMEVTAGEEDSPAVDAADIEARKQGKRLVVITRYEFAEVLKAVDDKSRGLPSERSKNLGTA